MSLQAYVDTDYVDLVVDRRSTLSYCTFLGENLVTWRSKKLNVVAISSVEAKFKVMALGVCELPWIKIILDDLKIKWEKPMRLYYDKKLVNSIAHYAVQHYRTKHIEVDEALYKREARQWVDLYTIHTNRKSTGRHAN